MSKKESKGWISVADELPEEDGAYLVLREDGDIGQGFFLPGNSEVPGHFMHDSETNTITHWQPYPLNPGVL